jgi:hypothetical protein
MEPRYGKDGTAFIRIGDEPSQEEEVPVTGQLPLKWRPTDGEALEDEESSLAAALVDIFLTVVKGSSPPIFLPR